MKCKLEKTQMQQKQILSTAGNLEKTFKNLITFIPQWI